MTRELRRLLISPDRLRAAGERRLAITEAEAHYLRRVLRLGSGDPVAVVDGMGQLWTAELTSDRALQLQQPLAQPLQRCGQLSPGIELAMAVPRRDGELVWRMATELGVDCLQPLIAERSQARERGLDAWPLQRWSTILQEASEQCERLWLPQLKAPRHALELLADPPGGLGLIATTRRPGLPLLEELLTAMDPTSPRPQALSLAIGPEGGWSEPELAVAEGAGWRAVTLGDSILRTATAAIAGVARLASWRALSCASSPWPSP
ncbi:MAG: 16S rRNA (uracil(1498)-N(3))-methyltransferase [Cyanobium sp.]